MSFQQRQKGTGPAILVVLAVFAMVPSMAGCPSLDERVLPPSESDDRPLVPTKTASGIVVGIRENDVTVYRGIPYAAPPTGDFRWKPPQPLESWKEARSCTTFAPASPQPQVSEIEGGGDLGEFSEDCLYLNVWTPAPGSEQGLPVMVWIHGGAFLVGAGSSPEYPGDRLARKGVVVVTINYRLGPFGFLAHPGLSQESPHGVSGNYGILDQIEALKWVRTNIHAFGGDPSRVTLFGESAGAHSVGLLLLSPQAEGLFHRAIMQSGILTSQRYVTPSADGSVSRALEAGRKLAAKLHCDEENDVPRAMRMKTPEEIMEAAESPLEIISNTDGFVAAPIYDGWLIPEKPEQLLRSGRFHNVPLIVGTDQDEGSVFVDDLSVDSYRSWIERHLGPASQDVFAMFPVQDEQDIPTVANRFFTTLWFTEPARFLARSMAAKNAHTYLYRFAYAPKHFWMEHYGAYHGVEVPYVFGNLSSSNNSETDKSLSERIMNYWVNFAKNGNPNAAALPDWPAYEKPSELHLEFGETVTVKSGLDKAECDLIERLRSRE